MIIEVFAFYYSAFSPAYKEHCFNNCISQITALVKYSVAEQHLVHILKLFFFI